MNIKKLLMLSLSLFIMSSCKMDAKKTPVITSISDKFSTLQPTVIISPSSTVSLPTYVLSPTLTPTTQSVTPEPTFDPIENLAGYERYCLPVTESSISEVDFPGQILIYRPDYYQFIDLTEHQAKNLVTGNISIGKVYDVSPNKHKLIASVYGESDLLILESTGTIIKKIKYQDQWKLIRWLDDQHLLIHLREPGNSLVVYDPIQEQIIYSFEIDSPNAYYVADPPGQNFTFTMLDPTAKQAIYFDRENGGRAVLWNIEARKILAWLPIYVPPTATNKDYYASHLPPIFNNNWSPDGSQFVLAAPVNYTNTLSSPSESEELFSISPTGVIQQLTHFTDIFNYVHIEYPEWSPDSIQLTFWLQTASSYIDKKEGPYRLIIYDTQSHLMKDYCLSFVEPWMDVIWSPSGKQLIIQSIHEKTNIRTVYFLDLEEGITYKFRYDPIIEEWLFGNP